MKQNLTLSPHASRAIMASQCGKTGTQLEIGVDPASGPAFSCEMLHVQTPEGSYSMRLDPQKRFYSLSEILAAAPVTIPFPQSRGKSAHQKPPKPAPAPTPIVRDVPSPRR